MKSDILYYDEDGNIMGDSEYLQREMKKSFDYGYSKWEDVKPEEISLILTDSTKGSGTMVKRFSWKDLYDDDGNFIGKRQPRKCPTCAKYGIENRKLHRDNYNDGSILHWWGDCGHHLWNHSENRRRARVLNRHRYNQRQFNRPPPANTVKKRWWQFWKTEDFSAPFMDISNYGKKMIKADVMYHGQSFVKGGRNDFPHSEYWTTSFDHALGHALFGPDMEGDTQAEECKVCDGFGYYFPDDAATLGRDCEYCVEGWFLPTTYADDYIPQGKPMVFVLDVSDNYIPFIYDGENKVGISYILNAYDETDDLGWRLLPDAVLIARLQSWIKNDEIPEIVLEDTSAGYVSNESLAWRRILQALGQLGQ